MTAAETMPNKASAPQMAAGERGASQLATGQRIVRDDSFALLSEKGNIEEKNGEEKDFCFLN